MFSGAGISAESGVPTFRDDETGLWAKYDPYEVSSTEGWQAHPERVWAWYLWRYHLVKEVQPNAGHRAVAAWQAWRLRCVAATISSTLASTCASA